MNQLSSDRFTLELPRPANLLANRTPDHLAACFESLGTDCEIGNVQRFCGIEPEGLFRFSSLPYGSLLDMLDNRLRRVQDLALWRVFPHATSREWWMGFREGGIYYHSVKNFDDSTAAEVAAYELPRITAMVQQFLKDLARPSKIYVRCEPGRSLGDISATYRALCRHGRHALLWVDETDDPSRVGRVEVLQDRLLRGFIAKRSQNAAPPPPALAVWLTIASRALQILKPAQSDELTWQILSRPLAPLSHDAPLKLSAEIAVTALNVEGPSPPHPPSHLTWGSVARHTLIAETDWGNASIFSVPVRGLVPNGLYVASAWVWVPPDFGGQVSLIFPGSPSVRAWPAVAEHYGAWQRLVTSFRVPENLDRHFPSLLVHGPAGTEVFSAGWRFEPGVCPGDDLAAAA